MCLDVGVVGGVGFAGYFWVGFDSVGMCFLSGLRMVRVAWVVIMVVVWVVGLWLNVVFRFEFGVCWVAGLVFRLVVALMWLLWDDFWF